MHRDKEHGKELKNGHPSITERIVLKKGSRAITARVKLVNLDLIAKATAGTNNFY